MASTAATDFDKRLEDRASLRTLISQWNANRLDLFALSEPNEELEFHGVMRFYFQEDADQRVVTKCLRVASSASVRDVVATLIEKFRPDIRLLSAPDYSRYALYEIHENGDERQLAAGERPLVVQLRWHDDDREGRFLFRRIDAKSHLPRLNAENSLRFQKKRMSKREKKKLAKKQQQNAEAAGRLEGNAERIAHRLYSEMPETSFTRSISNPEAVMRRRRQQKLERKLQQFREESAALATTGGITGTGGVSGGAGVGGGGGGGPGAGGTLRIFGESLNRDVPYKTLLLSTHDTAAHVVREILDKYGLEAGDAAAASKYCLVQVFVGHPPSGAGDGGSLAGIDSSLVKEYILDDDDCPLAIERQHNRLKGTLSFHIRRRPHDYQPRKRKKKPKPPGSAQLPEGVTLDRLPCLQEIHTSHDGTWLEDGPIHRLLPEMTEIGGVSSVSGNVSVPPPHSQSMMMAGLMPRHCVVAHTHGGMVTVTPSGDPNAETYLNGQRIRDTSVLQHGAILKLQVAPHLLQQQPQGLPHHALQGHTFRFLHPGAGGQHPGLGHNPVSQHTAPPAAARLDRTLTRPASVGGDYEPKTERHASTNSDSGSHVGSTIIGRDPILPAVLEFWEDHENVFLDNVIGRLDPAQVQFKLAPTYALYMAARYRASTHFRPDCTPNERAMRLTQLVNRVAGLLQRVVEDRCNAGPLPNSPSLTQQRFHFLSFWLANASELLHFLKNDRHLSAYTLDAQDVLADSVRLCFRGLVNCLQIDLASALPHFIRNPSDVTDVDGPIAEVLNVLSTSMTLLRRCRVNAALTIQLFSQLFHFLNMWLFNATLRSALLTAQAQSQQPQLQHYQQNMCHRLWGSCLKRRLSKIVNWAERQGLELAADCHLSRIIQAAHFLQTPKIVDNAVELSQTCFKLNSLQLRTMLENYRVDIENGELPIPIAFVEQACKTAEAREAAIASNPDQTQEIRLEEDPDLQLPFLLPEDGYTCEVIRGVPTGLSEFLAPLANAGLCRLTLQPSSIGLWTIYMSDQDIHMRQGPTISVPTRESNVPCVIDGQEESIYNQPPPHPQPVQQQQAMLRPGVFPPLGQVPQRPAPPPEVCTLYLKKLNNSMGLSIIAAKGYGQEQCGIYIKSIVPGGAADLDGRLQAGDHLLKVDGQSLSGISQDMAAQLMTRTGEMVCLEVAKQGAILHGLGGLLQQSPMTSQTVSAMSSQNYNTSTNVRDGNRRHSERDLSSRLAPEYPNSQFDTRQHAHTLPNMSIVGHHHTGSSHQTPQLGYQSPTAGQRIQESRSVPQLNFLPHGQPQQVVTTGTQSYPGQMQQSQQPPLGYSQASGGENVRAASVSSLPSHYEQHKSGVVGTTPQHVQGPLVPALSPALTAQGRAVPVNAPPLGPKPNLAGHQHHLQQQHQQQPPKEHSVDYEFNESVYQNISMYQQQQRAGGLPLQSSHSQSQQPYSQTAGGQVSPNLAGPVPTQPSQQPAKPAPPMSVPQVPHLSGVAQVPSKPVQPAANMHSSAIYGQLQPPPAPLSQVGPAKPLPVNYKGITAGQNSSMVAATSVQYENHQMPILPNQVAPAQQTLIANQQHSQPIQKMSPPGHIGGNNLASPQYQNHVPQHRGVSPSRHSSKSSTGNGQWQETTIMDTARITNESFHVRSGSGANTGHHHNQLRADAKMEEMHDEVNRRHLRERMLQESTKIISGSQQNRLVRETHESTTVIQQRKVEIKDRYEGIGQPLLIAPNGILSKTARDREEKERKEKERLEQIRAEIEAEIAELEAMQSRDEKQEDRLRCLRLESEFRRRAMEGEDEEDDDEDVVEDLIDEDGRRTIGATETISRRHGSTENAYQFQQAQLQNQDQLTEKEGDQNKASQTTLLQHEETRERESLDKQQKQIEHITARVDAVAISDAVREDEPPPLPKSPPPPLDAPLCNADDNKNAPIDSESQQDLLEESLGAQTQPQTPTTAALNVGHSNLPAATLQSVLKNSNGISSSPTKGNLKQPNLSSNDSDSSTKVSAKKKVSFHETHTEVSYDNYEDDYYDEGDEDDQMVENENYYRQMALHMERMEHLQHIQQQQQQSTAAQAQQKQHAAGVMLGGQEDDHPGSAKINGDETVAVAADEQVEKYTLEDIDEVLNQPQLTYTTQAPGVIGSQEVYRDPRQRIISAKQSQKESSPPVGPEKLTFQEKMKMFAKGVGERTPKSKTSLSKAQREIDHLSAPTPNC